LETIAMSSPQHPIAEPPVQFKLVLPADLKRWLEREAKRNLRSQSAEIISVLRDRQKEIAGRSTGGDF
jgi:hypothetical protein